MGTKQQPQQPQQPTTNMVSPAPNVTSESSSSSTFPPKVPVTDAYANESAIATSKCEYSDASAKYISLPPEYAHSLICTCSS